MNAPTLDAFRTPLADAVRDAVRDLYGIALDRIALERPPRVELGDLACPVAFDLAKPLKRAPRALAE